MSILPSGLEVVRFPTLAGGTVSHSHFCVTSGMAPSNPFRWSAHPRNFPVTFILGSTQLETHRDSFSAQRALFSSLLPVNSSCFVLPGFMGSYPQHNQWPLPGLPLPWATAGKSCLSSKQR